MDILYEDEHIALINKPSGMLSQKAKDTDESLVEYFIDYLLDKGTIKEEDLKTFRPSVCNRLDRNTSGLVVAGKTLPGLQIMAAVFKDRSIHKYYQCVVKGVIKEKQLITGFITKEDDIGTVESPFGKVQLVQLIGVKAEEIEQMKNKTMTPAQLAEILKDGLTDYKR